MVESTTRAGYYPGATRMKMKLIVERRTGRLLGAQIVGEENAGKRIDGLAIAIWNAMTVEEMTGLDLAYAPPFSPGLGPGAHRGAQGRRASGSTADTVSRCASRG